MKGQNIDCNIQGCIHNSYGKCYVTTLVIDKGKCISGQKLQDPMNPTAGMRAYRF